MERQVLNIFFSGYFIVLGLLFTFFHEKLGQNTHDLYQKFFHIRFSKKGVQIAFLLGGIIFVVFGLLSLFKIIRLVK